MIAHMARRSAGRAQDPTAGSAEAAAPRWFGGYEVLGFLARGGMAELYLARRSGPSGFEKLVAVKRILPELSAEPDVVDLFLNEARLAATLQHPNIVQVHDVGEEDGCFYLAMEVVGGLDVRTLMRRAHGPIPLEVGLGIAIGVCAALHHAHEQVDSRGRPLQIIHCDVSPSNVLLSFDGAVKLTDFGIAKAIGAAAETRQSRMRGKFGYMSPEQCLCEPLDRRSDIFAVGILLAELITGERLYDGKSDFEIMKKIVEQPAAFPPPGAEIPDALVRLVGRALERDRARRFDSALELQIALEELARESRLAVSPVTVARFVGQLAPDAAEAWQAGGAAGWLGGPMTGTLPLAAAPQSAEAETVGRPRPRPGPSRPADRGPSRRLAGTAALLTAAVLLALLAVWWQGRASSPPAEAAPAALAPAPVSPAAASPPPMILPAAAAPPTISPDAAHAAAAATDPQTEAPAASRPAAAPGRSSAARPSRRTSDAARGRTRTRARRASTPPAAASWDPDSAAPPPP